MMQGKKDESFLSARTMNTTATRSLPMPTPSGQMEAGTEGARIPGRANYAVFHHKLCILSAAQVFSQLNIDKFSTKWILDILGNVLAAKLEQDCMLLGQLRQHAGLEGVEELTSLWRAIQVRTHLPKRTIDEAEPDTDADESQDELALETKPRQKRRKAPPPLDVQTDRPPATPLYEIDALFEEPSSNEAPPSAQKGPSQATSAHAELPTGPSAAQDERVVTKHYNAVVARWLFLILGTPLAVEAYRLAAPQADQPTPMVSLHRRQVYEELLAYLRVQRLWISSLLKKLAVEASHQHAATLPGRKHQVSRRMLIPEALLALFKTLPSPSAMYGAVASGASPMAGSSRLADGQTTPSEPSGWPTLAIASAELRGLLAEPEAAWPPLPAAPPSPLAIDAAATGTLFGAGAVGRSGMPMTSPLSVGQLGSLVSPAASTLDISAELGGASRGHLFGSNTALQRWSASLGSSSLSLDTHLSSSSSFFGLAAEIRGGAVRSVPASAPSSGHSSMQYDDPVAALSVPPSLSGSFQRPWGPPSSTTTASLEATTTRRASGPSSPLSSLEFPSLAYAVPDILELSLSHSSMEDVQLEEEEAQQSQALQSDPLVSHLVWTREHPRPIFSSVPSPLSPFDKSFTCSSPSSSSASEPNPHPHPRPQSHLNEHSRPSKWPPLQGSLLDHELRINPSVTSKPPFSALTLHSDVAFLASMYTAVAANNPTNNQGSSSSHTAALPLQFFNPNYRPLLFAYGRERVLRMATSSALLSERLAYVPTFKMTVAVPNAPLFSLPFAPLSAPSISGPSLSPHLATTNAAQMQYKTLYMPAVLAPASFVDSTLLASYTQHAFMYFGAKLADHWLLAFDAMAGAKEEPRMVSVRFSGGRMASAGKKLLKFKKRRLGRDLETPLSTALESARFRFGDLPSTGKTELEDSFEALGGVPKPGGLSLLKIKLKQSSNVAALGPTFYGRTSGSASLSLKPSMATTTSTSSSTSTTATNARLASQPLPKLKLLLKRKKDVGPPLKKIKVKLPKTRPVPAITAPTSLPQTTPAARPALPKIKFTLGASSPNAKAHSALETKPLPLGTDEAGMASQRTRPLKLKLVSRPKTTDPTAALEIAPGNVQLDKKDHGGEQGRDDDGPEDRRNGKNEQNGKNGKNEQNEQQNDDKEAPLDAQRSVTKAGSTQRRDNAETRQQSHKETPQPPAKPVLKLKVTLKRPTK